jgi:hypothetical protein
MTEHAIHLEHADESREHGFEEEYPGEQYDVDVEEDDEDPGDEYDGGDDPSPYNQDDEEDYSESDEAGRRHPDAW